MTERELAKAFWPTLVGLGVGAEVYGLMRDKRGLTLSSYVWETQKGGKPVVRKSVVGIIVLYLGVHWLFGGGE